MMNFVYNYRIIVVNILIYDLIAMDLIDSAESTAFVNDTDNTTAANSGRRVCTPRTTSSPAADNCTAINENVDNFDEPNRNIAVAAAVRRRRPRRCRRCARRAIAADVDDSSSPTGNAMSTVAMSASTMSSSSSSSIAELSETTAVAVGKSCDTSSTAAATANSASSTSTSINSTTTTLATAPLSSQRILSRSKRFLAFPEGSSFSVAVCFTVGIIGNPRFNYMSFGLNWGVAYDLPNTSWILNHLHGFSRHPAPVTMLRRRTRRALYREIENGLENMGYNGRDCVLRALCESRQYFQKTKMTMIGEMVRTIFSLPKQRIFTRELREYDDIEQFDHAYRRARSLDCAGQYDCSFSLLELAFGKYSTPPPGYYDG